MSHSFFAYIARMRYISRWGLMRNTDPENVQEHSHMVAVLAHALAVIRRDKFGGTIDPGHVAAVALYHDAPEIFTGDLPTPVKYANDTIQAAYKAVEANAAARLTAMLPPEMQPAFAALLSEPDPEVPFRLSGEPTPLGDGPQYAISNSFGFGGHNAVLVVGSAD